MAAAAGGSRAFLLLPAVLAVVPALLWLPGTPSAGEVSVLAALAPGAPCGDVTAEAGSVRSGGSA